MGTEKIIGQNIRALREQQNMEQQELAKRLGITKQVLSNYELGVRKIPHDLVVRIADYFGVSIDHLYGRNEK